MVDSEQSIMKNIRLSFLEIKNALKKTSVLFKKQKVKVGVIHQYFKRQTKATSSQIQQ